LETLCSRIMRKANASEVVRAYGLPTVGAPLLRLLKTLCFKRRRRRGGSYRRLRGPLAFACGIRRDALEYDCLPETTLPCTLHYPLHYPLPYPTLYTAPPSPLPSTLPSTLPYPLHCTTLYPTTYHTLPSLDYWTALTPKPETRTPRSVQSSHSHRETPGKFGSFPTAYGRTYLPYAVGLLGPKYPRMLAYGRRSWAMP
jgi:hypothetical protein